MRFWWLLLIPLAGCIQFEDSSYDHDLRLEGHLVGTSIWTDHAAIILDGPSITEPAPGDPIGTPGMGDAHSLSLPTATTTLEVRPVGEAGELTWYRYRIDRSAWSYDHDERRNAVEVATSTGNATVSIPIPGIGLWAVYAEGSGSSNDFIVAVDARWNVSGTVYPQRGDGDPAPSNYDAMADRYTVLLPTTLAGVRINSFPADDTPLDDVVTGDDVDVGLWGADGTPIVCEGSGGTLDKARESLEAAIEDLVVYDVSFAIGAMPDDCTNGQYHYENQRQVQYTAVLETRYAMALA